MNWLQKISQVQSIESILILVASNQLDINSAFNQLKNHQPSDCCTEISHLSTSIANKTPLFKLRRLLNCDKIENPSLMDNLNGMDFNNNQSNEMPLEPPEN